MTIIFVHIPKTAGSTFLSISNNNYKSKEVFQIDGLYPEDSLSNFEGLSLEKRNSYRIIQGHLTLNLHTKISNGYKYITYLRDPIELFFSTFYYIKRTRKHNYYNIVNSMNSIDEFVEFRKENNQDNLQTRHLAGIATNMEKGNY